MTMSSANTVAVYAGSGDDDLAQDGLPFTIRASSGRDERHNVASFGLWAANSSDCAEGVQ
jgi:hypothetical protein